MRTIVLSLVLAATTALPVAAGSSRSLTASVPAGQLERVSLEAGVGEVHLTGGDADTVLVSVVLTPRRGGLFSSLKRGTAEVAAAELVADASGGDLALRVSGPSSDDRRFEEEWTIQMPARLLARVELGVGEATLRGLTGGAELHIGVGDGRIEALEGDITAEVGVGDLTVSGPATEYGPVTCSSGVGDATILASGRTISGSGFMGKSAEWRSAGTATMELETGVGDVEVKLTD